MPRTKKPAGAAVDQRNGRRTELAAAAVARFELPDKPRGWSAEVRTAWEAFWCDPVAQALTEVDQVVLLRWADHLDRAVKQLRLADRKPLDVGSMGQAVTNPRFGVADQALKVVEKCEAQLGIGALNRARLGIAIVTERHSLAALNERYAQNGVPDDGEDDDPRTVPGKVVD